MGLGERAFTMVEVAMSLAIVAFALVAIIGIMPIGLNVQRDNEQDTIIAQDGAYLLEAIKNGGLVTNLNVIGDNLLSLTVTNGHGDIGGMNVSGKAWNASDGLSSAEVILQICRPRSITTYYDSGILKYKTLTNEVRLRFKAFSGNMTALLGANDFDQFRYEVRVEIVKDETGDAGGYDPGNALSLYTVKLTYLYPVLANDQLGLGERVFRTMLFKRPQATVYGSDFVEITTAGDFDTLADLSDSTFGYLFVDTVVADSNGGGG